MSSGFDRNLERTTLLILVRADSAGVDKAVRWTLSHFHLITVMVRGLFSLCWKGTGMLHFQFSFCISISISHSPYVFMQMVHLYPYRTTTDGNFFSSTKQTDFKWNLNFDSTDAASIKLDGTSGSLNERTL